MNKYHDHTKQPYYAAYRKFSDSLTEDELFSTSKEDFFEEGFKAGAAQPKQQGEEVKPDEYYKNLTRKYGQ